MQLNEVISEPLYTRIKNFGAIYPYNELITKQDEGLDRKIIFSISNPAKKVHLVNPGLNAIARLLNIYEYEQISSKRIYVSAVVFGEGVSSVLNNSTYINRYFVQNPNSELIHSLTKAHVKIYACWQSMQDYNINEHMVDSEIEIVNSAMNILSHFQQDKYSLIAL
jgi:intracellular sulfur oxidation DsrE/DsrF family protein